MGKPIWYTGHRPCCGFGSAPPVLQALASVCCIGLLGFNAVALAQAPVPGVPPASPAGAAPAPPKASIELGGQLDLARLVDLSARQLGVAIDYDAAALRQQAMTLRPTGPIDNRTLWALTNRSLQQRGFVTVALPEMPGLSVVKIEEAARAARMEEAVEVMALASASPQPWKPAAGFRNAVFKLTNISSKEAADVVRSVLSRGGGGGGGEGKQSGGVGPIGNDPQLLLVSETSTRIDEAVGVLVRIDVPDRSTVSREIQVQNLSSAQVAATVAQLASKREAIAGEKLIGEVLAAPNSNRVILISPQRLVPVWQALIEQADRREPVETVAYTPRIFAVRDVGALIQQIAGSVAGAATADERFKIIIEEPTGTILVTGTSSQHAKVRELLERLDNVPGEARRPMRAFVIRNRPIGELMDVLSRMIAAGALDADPSRPSTPGTSGISPVALPTGTATGMSPATSAPSTQPGFSPYTTTPAAPLIPGASPSAAGIASSTNRPLSPQALPITLTADEATNTIIAIGDGRLLAQVEMLLKVLDVRQPQVMLEVVLVTLSERDSLTLGVELQQVLRNGDTTTTLSSLFGLSTSSPGGGLLPAAAAGFTGAVIRPGDFAVIVKALQALGDGRSVSLPKVLLANNQRASFDSLVQEPYGVSFTQGNSSTTSVTFGGTLDAGTQLSIKPQITEGETVLLDYSISISSFGEQGKAGNLPPSRQVNSVQSLASVPDGYTVVVGGLESTTESQSVEQVPILGSIPLLGEAFKNQSKNKTRSRFFVLIRASVLRGQSLEALRYLSDPMIRQAGVPSDWPASTPQIIK